MSTQRRIVVLIDYFFFFSSRRRHTRFDCDWSSDVCSSDLKCAVVFADIVDPVTNEFLRERVGIARVNEIYDRQVPGAVWQARYFRDSQPEEYAAKLKPDGSLFALQHKIAEDAPGASLDRKSVV